MKLTSLPPLSVRAAIILISAFAPAALAVDGTWQNAAPQTVTLTTTNGDPSITYSGADPNNDLVVGDAIRISNTTVGLLNNNVYYVLSKSGSAITLGTTPGGTAVAPTATASSSYTRSFQWNTSVPGVWAGGVVANGVGATANFTTVPSNNVYVTSGSTLTIGNINLSANGNLQIASSTTNPGTLNFAVSSGTPTLTNSGTAQFIFVPGFNTNQQALKITGNQGLLFNGTGTNTTTQFQFNTGIDWTGFSGGYTVQDGIIRVPTGAFPTTQSLTLGNASTTGLASLDVTGAANAFDGLNGTAAGRVFNTNTTVRTLTVGSAGGSGTFAGIIGTKGNIPADANSAAINLTKAGAGTQLLNGANTYTGTTTVSGGTLGGLGSINSANTVTVAGAASLLGGDGVNASGAFSINGNVTLSDNSIIKLTLGAGNTHSTLARTSGTWVFDGNQAFTFNNDAVSGTYDNIITGLSGSETGLSSIGTWVISNPGFTGTFSFDGAGGVDLALTVVPEPTTWIMMIGGMGMLGLVQMRRRRA